MLHLKKKIKTSAYQVETDDLVQNKTHKSSANHPHWNRRVFRNAWFTLPLHSSLHPYYTSWRESAQLHWRRVLCSLNCFVAVPTSLRSRFALITKTWLDRSALCVVARQSSSFTQNTPGKRIFSNNYIIYLTWKN